MRTLVKTRTGAFVVATVVMLAGSLVLFAAASAMSNDILRYYLYGAAAASLGCSTLLFAASQAFARCARLATAPS